jgi:rhodanese-related sulfurtransferase
MNERGRWVVGVIGLVLLLGAGACQKTTSDRDLEFVGPEEAESLLDRGPGLLNLRNRTGGVFLDPRSRAEFDAGHIPGAIHLPFERIRREYGTLSSHSAIVVYGTSFNSPVANSASKTLIELGMKNVYTLQGGLQAWKAAGNTVDVNE